MEIRTLVFIGIACIIVSMSLYLYLNKDTLFDNLKTVKKRLMHETKTKQELNAIDTKSQEKIDKATMKAAAEPAKPNIIEPVKPVDVTPDVEDLNKGLEKLKQDLELSFKTHAQYDKNRHDLINKTNVPKSSTEPPKTEQQPSVRTNEEVFLVKSNMFNKTEGNKVCKALFNSRAATREELNADYNNGANWCNYGWTNDGSAYYPLQQDSDTPMCVGSKGLNGGTLGGAPKLGLSCYGEKPVESNYTSLTTIYRDASIAESDISMLENYRQMMSAGKIKIAPFNDKAWSRYSFKDDKINIGRNVVVSQKKDTSNDPNSIKIEKMKITSIV